MASCLLSVTLPVAARAASEDPVIIDHPSIGPVVCDRLNDRDLYNKDDYADFKMLLNAEDGWMFRSRLDLKYRFRLTERAIDAFARLNEAFRQNGSDLVITMLPTRGMTAHEKLRGPWAQKYDVSEAIRSYNAMLDYLRTSGVRIVDLQGFENIDNFFYPRDNHWTAEGARFTAQALAREIASLPAYRDIPKKSYITRSQPVGEELLPNRYELVANEICAQPDTRSRMPELFVTEDVQKDGLNEQDLFGAAPSPEIALLGTSNSTSPDPSYSNFSGFLKEYAEADIANEAISGGSLQGSITHYLLTGRYHQHKPKIIVWEMSAYYGYNQQDFFREIIPAVYGECADDMALATTQVTLPEDDGQDVVLFDDLDRYNLQNHNAYAVLKFDSPEARNIKVRFFHQDGRRDTVDLRRPHRSFPETNGIYYAQVGNLIEAPVSQIAVNAKKIKGAVSAKLCKMPDVKSVTADKDQETQTASTAPQAPKIAVQSWFDTLVALVFKEGNAAGEIRIRKIPDHSKAASAHAVLPDLSGYTPEAIRTKRPQLKDGGIEIAPMEGATPLRKYAFDKRLVEARNIQGRIQPLAIHIRSGVHNFKDLAARLQDEGYLSATKAGYLLRLPIALYPESALIIEDLDRPVLLSQDKGAFIASAGNLFIRNSKIIGWNETKNKPATLNKDFENFRPFITTWDGSALYIADSRIENLGYAASKSYGISVSSNDVVQEEFFDDFGDLPLPTGWIVNSTFKNMYFGFYSYEAEDVVIYNNRYQDNIIYGIDPHDRSERLIIAGNHVTGSKKKHGIIISREVNNSYIIDNTVEYNAGSGIMIDRDCRGTVIAGNITRHNGGDGLTLYESPDNTLIDNIAEHNAGAGLRIRNSWDIRVRGGRIAMNKAQAIIGYQDTLSDTNRDFELDPVTPRTQAAFENVSMESNKALVKTNGFAALSFKNMDWRYGSLSRNKFDGDLKPLSAKLEKLYAGGQSFILESPTASIAPQSRKPDDQDG